MLVRNRLQDPRARVVEGGSRNLAGSLRHRDPLGVNDPRLKARAPMGDRICLEGELGRVVDSRFGARRAAVTLEPGRGRPEQTMSNTSDGNQHSRA